MAAPEYDRFADEARASIAQQMAEVAAYQEQARRLLEQGEGDVAFVSPD